MKQHNRLSFYFNYLKAMRELVQKLPLEDELKIYRQFAFINKTQFYLSFNLIILGMAKQTGHIKIIGTYGNLCFYMMWGKYYVRTKSNLTGKRVKKDKRFARTMEEARLLGNASSIASFVYNSLYASCRKHWMFNKLTGEASRCLRKGMRPEDAILCLYKAYDVYVKQEAKGKTPVRPRPYALKLTHPPRLRVRWRKVSSNGLFLATLPPGYEPVRTVDEKKKILPVVTASEERHDEIHPALSNKKEKNDSLVIPLLPSHHLIRRRRNLA